MCESWASISISLFRSAAYSSGVGLAGKPSCDPRFIEVETKRNLKLEGASQSDENIRYDNKAYNEIND